MTEETTPPTPDEVDTFLAGVENWHDSMPFYNDDLGKLLKEFRRLRAALPRLREARDAERDALAQKIHELVRERDAAQAGTHFAMTAGVSYSQEVDRLNETVKGLRERNEILAAAHERDTEALGTIRKVVFEDAALHHEQRMGRIAAALVKAEEGL